MSLLSRALTDGDRLDIAGATIVLKVNRRARRVSLRLDRTRREIIATAPTPRRLAEAAAFARERAGWIAQRLAELPPPTPLASEMTIALFGDPVRLERGTGRARWIAATEAEPASIRAMGEGEGFARAVILVIKHRAREVLSARTAVHAARLGAPMPKVTIMDAKARWGSCRLGIGAGPASVRYSWRLALAPMVVADYVAAHETAHLIEQNHGPGFWKQVRALVGDEAPHRAWLRAEGPRLHAFGR